MPTILTETGDHKAGIRGRSKGVKGDCKPIGQTKISTKYIPQTYQGLIQQPRSINGWIHESSSYVAEDCFNLTLMGREALGSVEYWWPIVNIHFVLPSPKKIKKPLIIDFWNSQCRVVSYSLRILSIKFLPQQKNLVELASNYTFLISFLLYYFMILFTISSALFMTARLML